jgi:hypothetical protein
MADWGLYTALRGVDDWQQKRQDRALSMSIAKERNAIAQQKVAEQTAFEGKLIEYFNQLENMDVMPEDAERIQQLAKKEQSNVVNQIAKYNGDLKRFMTSGGLTVLNSYKNNIMKSEEVNTALQNKANLTSFVTAIKDNKFIFPVTVNIPTGETDENGNPTYKQEKTTFEKALALKKQGIINELPSVLFEDKIDVNSLDFYKTFKNNADPYSVQVVTQNDLINRLKEQGASEEQATFRALEYGDRVNKGGSPMYWNRKDPYEKWLEEQKLNLQKQKLMSGGSGSDGGARITNAESNQILTLGVGQSAPLTPEAKSFWLTALGADLDPTTGLWKINSTLKAFDADEVPVGAIVVAENKIIARAHNLTERLNDVTAHAEMQAITSAANYLSGNYKSI